eukprot:1188909-Prorocentrum_minimum.AAC.2
MSLEPARRSTAQLRTPRRPARPAGVTVMDSSWRLLMVPACTMSCGATTIPSTTGRERGGGVRCARA